MGSNTDGCEHPCLIVWETGLPSCEGPSHIPGESSDTTGRRVSGTDHSVAQVGVLELKSIFKGNDVGGTSRPQNISARVIE